MCPSTSSVFAGDGSNPAQGRGGGRAVDPRLSKAVVGIDSRRVSAGCGGASPGRPGLTLYSEDELLPLSGLQHLVFCERQWGLIHIEQAWTENRLTAEGRVLHERAHEAGSETRPGLR